MTQELIYGLQGVYYVITNEQPKPTSLSELIVKLHMSAQASKCATCKETAEVLARIDRIMKGLE